MEEKIPDFVNDCINLATPRLGAYGLFASDEFFAPLSRLLMDEPAIFIPDKYDDHGKWMDGWESRRRRGPGHDYAIIQLGTAGVIKGFDVDTSHFTGNYPPAASIDVCNCQGAPDTDTVWTTVVSSRPLGPDAHHYLSCVDDAIYTHVRLNIHPDGGVARLRVYGVPVPIWHDAQDDMQHELSALCNGGQIISYNDAHYGSVWTLLTEGRGQNMGDGWETRRRREPGNDWIIVALGARGVVDRIEVDTCHFKGNFPESCSIQAADMAGASTQSLVTQSVFWPDLLERQKLSADSIHEFGSDKIVSDQPVSHVRLNIFPDGGISRLRLFGRIV